MFDGVLLADDMGTGKTLATLAFCRRALEMGREQVQVQLKKCNIQKVVVLCPASLVQNWVREEKKHRLGLNPVAIVGSL